MATRTKQRRAAVWSLYQSDLLNRPLADSFDRDAHQFTKLLAAATQVYQDQIDELIERHSNGWPLARIAPLERSIMRVALLEMTHPEAVPGDSEIPPEGAIDEAVETAKVFCGVDAPKFVNGVLGAVLRDLQSAAS